MTDTPDPAAVSSPAVKAAVLSEALPYIRRFHGKTIVVKYGGNAMTEERLQRSFAHDVVLLKLVGLNPVVVHGGGPQIDDALRRIGKQGTFIQGMRVTDAETMEVVEWVLGGQVQQDIVINEVGKAVGLTGKDGGLIQAQKKLMANKDNPAEPIDIGFVGDITLVEPAVVKALQDDQFIPVISPSAMARTAPPTTSTPTWSPARWPSAGRREAADADQHGRAGQGGKLLRSLSAQTIDELFADGTISGGMLPKISSALDAAKNGVNSVHIVDGRVPHCLLLEILTDQGVGTMISSH